VAVKLAAHRLVHQTEVGGVYLNRNDEASVRRAFEEIRGRLALEDVLLRVSRPVEELPEIVELDLNPVFTLPPGQGCRSVDARVRVGAPARRRLAWPSGMDHYPSTTPGPNSVS
jgi:acyl-CoA synthetase (NDP forming)